MIFTCLFKYEWDGLRPLRLFESGSLSLRDYHCKSNITNTGLIGDPNIEVAVRSLLRGVFMGKGGGFKRKKKPKKQINPCKEGYIRWRMCQGYSEVEAQILFENLDSFRDELNEPNVYLETIAKFNLMFSKGTKTISTATSRIWNRYEKDAETYLHHINRLTTIMNLVSVGNYDAATVLLRSSIEAFLRSNLLFIDALSTKNLISSVDRNEEWECAISDDPKEAMSIGSMCRLIKKLGYNGNIRKPYYFMKINHLNEITHSNIKNIKRGDDNILNNFSISKEFNEVSCEKFVQVFLRFVEFQIVFWQCIIDEFDPRMEPVIIFYLETPAGDDTFPKYQKVLENRFKEEFAEYFRLESSGEFNRRLPTLRELIEANTKNGWPKGWWKG